VNNNESDNYSDKIDENNKISFGKKNGGSDWKKIIGNKKLADNDATVISIRD